jgi:hypothetical protein
MNFELIKLVDRVDNFMRCSTLFRRHVKVARRVSLSERSYREVTSEVRDSVGISEENITSQTPIVGVQSSVDGDAANDDGAKRHKSQNVIKHLHRPSLARGILDHRLQTCRAPDQV